MIDNLEEKLEGKLPVTRKELFKLISSWGRNQQHYTYDNIYIKECESKECYDLSNLLHTSKHSFGISFLDSKNSYNKQLLYFTKLALICKQIIFNFYFYLVSQIEDFSDLFKYSLYSGNLSKWNTSSCTNMEWIFSFSIFNGNLSNWDVSNVKSFYCMFYENYSFNNDSLKDWDVSKIEEMDNMFSYSIFNGDISNWNVSKLEDMNFMFAWSQFNGNLSKWNISNVIDMDGAFFDGKFDGDISNWKFNKDVSFDNLLTYNKKFEQKYNNKEEIPFYTKEFLEWFETNRLNISNSNVSKEEKLDIDNYLSNFEIDTLSNDN